MSSFSFLAASDVAYKATATTESAELPKTWLSSLDQPVFAGQQRSSRVQARTVEAPPVETAAQ
eukprot:scaffold478953_cov14-Prasinocladus_malaysianus.AAC.1